MQIQLIVKAIRVIWHGLFEIIAICYPPSILVNAPTELYSRISIQTATTIVQF